MDLEVYAAARHQLREDACRLFGVRHNRTLFEAACRFECPVVDLGSLGETERRLTRCTLAPFCRPLLQQLVREHSVHRIRSQPV
jgi:hypothetical protein